MTALTILIKNTLKKYKSTKAYPKDWPLTFIFDIYFSVNFCRVSLSRSYMQTWRIFCKIVLFLHLSKIVGDITKNLIRILRRCVTKEYFCNEVEGFQNWTLLNVNFTTFTFHNLVNCLWTLISGNKFEPLFPQFISWIYFFCLVNE